MTYSSDSVGTSAKGFDLLQGVMRMSTRGQENVVIMIVQDSTGKPTENFLFEMWGSDEGGPANDGRRWGPPKRTMVIVRRTLPESPAKIPCRFTYSAPRAPRAALTEPRSLNAPLFGALGALSLEIQNLT